MPLPAGAAVWLGAGEEVGESDRMVSVVFPARAFVVPGTVFQGRGRFLTMARWRRLFGKYSWGSCAVPGMIRRGCGASGE